MKIQNRFALIKKYKQHASTHADEVLSEHASFEDAVDVADSYLLCHESGNKDIDDHDWHEDSSFETCDYYISIYDAFEHSDDADQCAEKGGEWFIKSANSSNTGKREPIYEVNDDY